MARFYGAIGYAHSSESAPGVWSDTITEKYYYGDVVRDSRSLEEPVPGGVNQNVVVSNAIRVVADAYASENIYAIRYVRWAGGLWTVKSVEVQIPRLLLRLGGVYNGPHPD